MISEVYMIQFKHNKANVVKSDDHQQSQTLKALIDIGDNGNK